MNDNATPTKAGPVRILVTALAVSLAGFMAIVAEESYTSTAIIPVKGDPPTIGFGSTVYEDGKAVKMGDKIEPVRALHVAAAHIGKDEKAFRASVPGVKLTQGEYDLYLDFAYQYGIGNWRTSTMRRKLQETVTAKPADLPGLYRASCDALLMWRKSGGYDCSTMVNGQRNRVCWGVWERQQKRHAKCLAEQEG